MQKTIFDPNKVRRESIAERMRTEFATEINYGESMLNEGVTNLLGEEGDKSLPCEFEHFIAGLMTVFMHPEAQKLLEKYNLLDAPQKLKKLYEFFVQLGPDHVDLYINYLKISEFGGTLTEEDFDFYEQQYLTSKSKTA